MLAVLVAVLLLAFSVISCSSAEDSPPPERRRAGTPFSACRSDPLADAEDAGSLEVRNECLAVGGVLRQATDNGAGATYSLLVEPDPAYRLLAAGTQGLLVVQVDPSDRPSVFIPAVGQHATYYGALVLDKGHDDSLQLRPTWLIATLDLATDLPAEVSVGDEVKVTIGVTSNPTGRPEPISEADLLVEMVDSAGNSLRSDTARTNTEGKASARYTALQRAGDYSFHVYASKGQERGFATIPFTVKRR